MTHAPRDLETDVLILGSGLAGSITALCLARQGLRVVLLDGGTHPRFALGESTTTPSSLWLKLLAERYGVPELHHLTTGEGVARHVAPTSGVKSNFGFLYHEPGGETLARSWQAVIPQADFSDADEGPSSTTEMHYFRQDVDAYLWSTALAAGVVGRSGRRVTRLEVREDGATAETDGGETIRCAFVVDASGYRSVVADALGLREDPPRMRTNSRALFTHMVGVKPYEEVDPGPRPLAPWSQGTLHHFFDGGWVWVIPFGNHRGSRNPLCSVGLSLDNRRFPRDPAVDPEEEWARFLAEHPSVARQFADAVPVRPWIATGRLQYSSSRCVGARFWLTAHAAGTVDALYSMGNINTFQSIATGVRLVLEAFERDAFTEAHFQPLQRLTDNLLRFQDRIVYGSYAAFRSPALLELWFTLWGLTDGARVREVLKPLVRYARTGDPAELTTFDARPEDVLTGFGQSTDLVPAEEVLDRLDAFCDLMQELEEGRATVAETEERLLDAMEADDRFDMLVDAITAGLGEHPWLFEPLRRLGVKAYSSAFLTPEEVLTLGVPRSEGAPRPAEPEVPAAEGAGRNGSAPRTLRERVQDLRRELGEYRAHTGALERELAAWRDQAAALERDRDAWRERAGTNGAPSPELAAQLAAQREHAEALERDRDAWQARAAEAEARLDRSLSDRVRKTLRGLGRREE